MKVTKTVVSNEKHMYYLSAFLLWTEQWFHLSERFYNSVIAHLKGGEKGKVFDRRMTTDTEKGRLRNR